MGAHTSYRRAGRDDAALTCVRRYRGTVHDEPIDPFAEIGRDLFVSEDTVKTHARRLFRKLGARDRAHAVASAFRAGLVT